MKSQGNSGLKSEGRISLEELKFCDKEKEVKIGDKINVYVERLVKKYVDGYNPS